MFDYYIYFFDGQECNDFSAKNMMEMTLLQNTNISDQNLSIIYKMIFSRTNYSFIRTSFVVIFSFFWCAFTWKYRFHITYFSYKIRTFMLSCQCFRKTVTKKSNFHINGRSLQWKLLIWLLNHLFEEEEKNTHKNIQ